MPLTPTLLNASSSGTLASSYTTPSISPSSDNLVLVLIGMRKLNGSSGGSISSFSGLSLSWTHLATTARNGDAWVDAFYAQAGSSPGSGTIAFSITGNATDQRWSDIVVHIIEVPSSFNTSSPVAQSKAILSSGAHTTLSGTLDSSPAATSLVIGMIAQMGDTDGVITPGGNYTELADTSTGTGGADVTVETEYDDSPGSTTVDWSGLANAGSNVTVGAALALEIAAAAGGSSGVQRQAEFYARLRQ